MFPTFAATTDSEGRQLREKVIELNISMKFGVFIGIMLRKRHINSKSKQTIMMKSTAHDHHRVTFMYS